jgi:hypothetical protein
MSDCSRLKAQIKEGEQKVKIKKLRREASGAGEGIAGTSREVGVRQVRAALINS